MTRGTHPFEELDRPQDMTMTESLSRGRRHLATSDDVLASAFGQLIDLFERALPTSAAYPDFVRHMNFASSQGYTWIQALDFAASQRDGS